MFFPNIQVASAAATREFWTSLGYGFNPMYTTEDVLCLELQKDAVAVMLHEADSFARFLPGTTASDSRATTEVLLSFDLDSREAVDALFEGVVAAGGTEARPTEDLGFMYTRSFRDLDGHVWEPFFMDEAKAAEMFAAGEGDGEQPA
ncbi:hypothetical protein C8046_15495 [Serinibacter arcticus]|uniref:VOC domain-containing protein n=1 Tax=Serinibacter arcticus TaxID=1655435 RepID=A0A2U1ZXX9_9MICO|nr:VOC family protein [Serinibacter arcticus]PWD51839.1 hypothetical protein C8046_15495 [Serinibacter arcticus]